MKIQIIESHEIDTPVSYPSVSQHNQSFLCHLLKLKPSCHHLFDQWFHHDFEPTICDSNGETLVLQMRQNLNENVNENLNIQHGGGTKDHIYTLEHNGKPYHIRIRTVMLANRHGDYRGFIYLMSPRDDDVDHRCLLAKILTSDPHTVELSDLTLNYNCTDQQRIHSKIGSIYVQLMTQFLIENHQKLDVTRIELTDNAYYRCPLNRRRSIHLELSRQLEGKEPYYVQFGYRPKYALSARKLVRNKEIMSQIMTREDRGLNALCSVYDCRPEITQYIRIHMDQPLSQTLESISRMDCILYSQIYEKLFENCGLKELLSPIYTIDME